MKKTQKSFKKDEKKLFCGDAGKVKLAAVRKSENFITRQHFDEAPQNARGAPLCVRGKTNAHGH